MIFFPYCKNAGKTVQLTLLSLKFKNNLYALGFGRGILTGGPEGPSFPFGPWLPSVPGIPGGPGKPIKKEFIQFEKN